MCAAKGRVQRYYVDGETVPFEEDSTHEFKGHSNLTMEDIPPRAKQDGAKSRAPVSRALNAFLNTGCGGTAYLGIIDNGNVGGLNLSQYEKDHMKVGLDDLMSNYTPPVEKHRYKLRFVPVVSPNCSPEEIEVMTTYDSSKEADPKLRQRPHVIRTFNYCWCAKDSIAQYNATGIMTQKYIAEITMKPWDSTDPRNKYPVGEMKSHPIHEDNEGKVYFRRQASVVQYSPQEIVNLARQTALNHYQPIKDSLQEKIWALRHQSNGTVS